jgi:hypothetical protein
MGSFTVEQVTGRKEWSGQHGEMVDFQVLLSGESEPVQLTQKVSTAPPSQGMTLTGEIVQQNGRRKFKKEQQQGGGGGGRNNPEDLRQRAAQGALSNAVALAAQHGGDISSDEVLRVADKLYGWLRAKAEGS